MCGVKLVLWLRGSCEPLVYLDVVNEYYKAPFWCIETAEGNVYRHYAPDVWRIKRPVGVEETERHLRGECQRRGHGHHAKD